MVRLSIITIALFAGSLAFAETITKENSSHLVPPFIYDGEEARSPFMPPNRRRGIFAFKVSQFKLVGVVTGGEKPRALVQDPLGINYSIALDDRMGSLRGAVVNIDQNKLVVHEEVYRKGEKITLEKTIKMYKMN